jgi:hypothetical protein
VRSAGQPDCMVVVNGPEDGAEFPVVRAPFHVGSDPLCAVNLSLDPTVRERHALVTVVSDGYRVRRAGRGRVWVDGREAGMFRSRIVRDGGVVQVGQTLLGIACSPDGLASRSRGIVTESDFGWTLQQVAGMAVKGVRGVVGLGLWALRSIFGSWWLLLAILVTLYFFWPWFNVTVRTLLWNLYGFLFSLLPGR